MISQGMPAFIAAVTNSQHAVECRERCPGLVSQVVKAVTNSLKLITPLGLRD